MGLGLMALSGCGAGEPPVPEGMSIDNPNGNLSGPGSVQGGGGAPAPQGAMPQPGQQLPGAPPGVTMPPQGGQ